MYQLEKQEETTKLYKDFVWQRAIIVQDGNKLYEGSFREADKEYNYYVVAANNRKRLANRK